MPCAAHSATAPSPLVCGHGRTALSQARRATALLIPLLAILAGLTTPASASFGAIDSYIENMVNTDSSIFAVTTALYNSVGGVQPDSTTTFGPRTFIQNGQPEVLSLLTQDTAYRMDTMGELLVALAALHLDRTGNLPCGLDLPLPPSVLPPFFGNETFLHNPAYPNSPITLRHLLEHTSTLSEAGFMDAARRTPVTEPVPSLTAFVDTLFDTYGNALFLGGLQPGIAASFYYSRTNTALATYVIDTQLALMQADVPPAQRTHLATYLMNTLFPILGLSNTFVLTPEGARSNAAYPPNVTVNWLPFIAIEDVNANGTDVVNTLTIHPAYTADFMLYTTTTDLLKLLAGVLVPGGVFYDTVVGSLARRAIAVVNAAVPFVAYRGAGVFNMSYTRLCTAMAAAVRGAPVPVCLYPARTVPSEAAAYGLFASAAFNQVAILCFPITGRPLWCSTSSVTYFENTSNVLSARLAAGSTAGGYNPSNPPGAFVNWALMLSVASLAEYTSYVPPPPSTTQPPPRPPDPRQSYGLYVFLGVLGTFILTILCSYVADYIIQPAPPAKLVVPVPVVPTGAAVVGREGGALMGGGGGGGAGDGPPLGTAFPMSGASPAGYPPALAPPPPLPSGRGGRGRDGGVDSGAFDRSGLPPTRLSLLDDDDDDDDTRPTRSTTTATGTRVTDSTYTTTISSAGTSPEGLRYRAPHTLHRGSRGGRGDGKKAHNSNSPEITSSTNSPSAAEDRSITGSQPHHRGGDRGSSRELPRFDAYI